MAIGTSFVASSVIVHYPFLGGQTIRYAAGAATLIAYLAIRRVPVPRPAGRQWIRLAALSATGQAGFNLAVLAALRSAEPAAVGVVVGCVPVVLALVEPLRSHRRPSARLVSAALVVVAGATVVQGLGHTDLVGLLYSIGALAGETAFSLLAIPLLVPLGQVGLSMYACAAAAVELGVAAVIVDGTAAVRLPTAREAVALGYLALVVTALAFACWYVALHLLGAERAGLFAGLIPVAAVLTAPLVGTGVLGIPQIAGCALVGAGVMLGVSATGRAASRPTLDVAETTVDRLMGRPHQGAHPGAGPGKPPATGLEGPDGSRLTARHDRN
jgi:drug/metabolite transporter (DMT)-like permease